jgi:hypothetical protein
VRGFVGMQCRNCERVNRACLCMRAREPTSTACMIRRMQARAYVDVGGSVGDDVGAGVGVYVGEGVGFGVVGVAVGEAVGIDVVGVSDGEGVGISVGEGVGKCVGLCVGACVGDGVRCVTYTSGSPSVYVMRVSQLMKSAQRLTG